MKRKAVKQQNQFVDEKQQANRIETGEKAGTTGPIPIQIVQDEGRRGERAKFRKPDAQRRVETVKEAAPQTELRGEERREGPRGNPWALRPWEGGRRVPPFDLIMRSDEVSVGELTEDGV